MTFKQITSSVEWKIAFVAHTHTDFRAKAAFLVASPISYGEHMKYVQIPKLTLFSPHCNREVCGGGGVRE